MKSDPGETKDLSAEKPDIVKKLQALADKAREDLGDSRKDIEGKNRRPAAVAATE